LLYGHILLCPSRWVVQKAGPGRAVAGGTARRQAQNVPLRTRLHGMTLHTTRKHVSVAFHPPIQLGGTEAEA
jgi:hypothetical protein